MNNHAPPAPYTPTNYVVDTPYVRLTELERITGDPMDSMLITWALKSGAFELAEEMMARHDELAGPDPEPYRYSRPAPTATSTPHGLASLTWDGFIGQQAALRELRVRTISAAKRGAPVPPVLLVGPGGTGKTTLANLVAQELDRPLVTFTKPPANTNDLIDELWMAREGVVFFDEVHLFTKRAQHDLMSLTEPPHVLQGRWTLDFPNLTVIAATTEPAALTGPLLSRFECKPAWQPYTRHEMVQIVRGMAERADLREGDVTAELTVTLAEASAGVPRQARALVMAARDLAYAGEEVTGAAVLSLCHIQPDGLTDDHIRYLNLLASQRGGTAGKEALATILDMAPAQVRVTERLLVERRLIALTGTGRQITPEGRNRVAGHAA